MLDETGQVEQGKRPIQPIMDGEKEGGAEGGTRTPMPLRAQRPERCVSTNFTTSAHLFLPVETCTILLYPLRLVNRICDTFPLP